MSYLNEDVLRASVIYALEAGRGLIKRDYLLYFIQLGIADTFNIVGDHLKDNIHFISILGKEDRKNDLIKFLDILPNKPRHSYLTNIEEGIRFNESNDEIERYIKLYPMIVFDLSFLYSQQQLTSHKENSMQTSQAQQQFKVTIIFTDLLNDETKRLFMLGYLGDSVKKIGKNYMYNGTPIILEERFNDGVELIQDSETVTFVKTNKGFDLVTEEESAKKFWEFLSGLSESVIESYTFTSIKSKKRKFI